ncbi:hypothetical protein KAH55_03215, partial [bacterium]|nr:hypothetical protein [bacterium]
MWKPARKYGMVLILLVALLGTAAQAQTARTGGKGLFYTYSAEVTDAHNLFVNGFITSYATKLSKTTLAKDYTISFAATYGLFTDMETYLEVVAYQDDQKRLWGPMGDTQLGFKYRLPFSKPTIHFGLNAFILFPSAVSSNVKYEPFRSGNPGAGIQFLTTFSLANQIPSLPLKIHLNWGYMDHKLKDSPFSSDIDQWLFGLGVICPIRSYQIYAEYSAEPFVQNELVLYSQSSSRLSFGFKFMAQQKYIIDIVGEIGLANDAYVEDMEADKLKPYQK